MAKTTILFLTDNRLRPDLMAVCRRYLLRAVGDYPVISVSQKPTDLGENICVGEIGSNWRSLYKQLLAGVEAATTEFVAVAEHDVIYSSEHFAWVPPDKETFWYNANHWFLGWDDSRPQYKGMYSYWPGRIALSQLIAPRELLLQSTRERSLLIEAALDHNIHLPAEPGLFPLDKITLARRALAEKGPSLYPLMERHLSTFKSDRFRTAIPNIDIRHGANYTGEKRGKQRCYELAPWGRAADVLAGVL